MAVDKLVDSTQLDADLTSVANAIRTKGGTSASLAFPAGFVQAIGDIPGGGGTAMESGSFIGTSSRNATIAVSALYSHIYVYASGVRSDDSLTGAPYGNDTVLGFFADNTTGFRYAVATNSGGTSLVGAAGGIGRWGGNTAWNDIAEFTSTKINLKTLSAGGRGILFNADLTYKWEAW